MKDMFQKTILEPVAFIGVGLHSGLKTKLKLIPANDNEGIVFKRVDLKKNNIISANFKNVSSAKLCTKLENSYGNSVSTVEHLMAAFYIAGIDNVVVEIDNQEVPIMDGSAKEFIKILNKNGFRILKSKRKFIKIAKKFELQEDQKTISIEPNNFGLEVNFQLDYENSLIGKQKNKVQFYNDELEDIYSSRTFCLFEDIEKIKSVGLAKGGSLENAVVIKDNKILNEGGLRNTKEFVNHKILDLAGDFLLSGYRIIGSVNCVQGGHHLSNIFLRELLKDKSNYLEFDLENVEPIKKDPKTPSNQLAVNA